MCEQPIEVGALGICRDNINPLLARNGAAVEIVGLNRKQKLHQQFIEPGRVAVDVLPVDRNLARSIFGKPTGNLIRKRIMHRRAANAGIPERRASGLVKSLDAFFEHLQRLVGCVKQLFRVRERTNEAQAVVVRPEVVYRRNISGLQAPEQVQFFAGRGRIETPPDAGKVLNLAAACFVLLHLRSSLAIVCRAHAQ